MRTEIEIWLKQAEKDLEAAEKNFKLNEWYLVAFLSQQAVEKALKALLLKKIKNPEMFLERHSLVYLGKMAKIPSKFFPFLRELTKDYIVSRYPGAGSIDEPPYELYDESKAKNVLKKAKEILRWIKQQIK